MLNIVYHNSAVSAVVWRECTEYLPHFVFVNSKGLAEKCTGSSLAAVTDPRSGRCIASGPSRMLKIQDGGSYTSLLVGSDRVDIARAFCTLLTYERILHRISTNFHAGDLAESRENLYFWHVRNVTRISARSSTFSLYMTLANYQ